MSGPLPLQGLRVLDLASFIAAPVATTVMGDYGAEVIKIEPPGEGDPQRKLGWDDRLVGTMRLALRYGVEPQRYARGAAAAALCLPEDGRQTLEARLVAIWGAAPEAEKQAVWQRIGQAMRT